MKLIYLLIFTFLFPFAVYSFEDVPVDAKESDKNTSKKADNITVDPLKVPETDLLSKLGTNKIANLFSDNINSSQEVVLVDKAKRRMYVAKISGNNMEVIKEFPVLTGRIDGNKKKQGDEKTPEGVYFVVSYTSGKDLVKKYGNYALIYGAGSFPINYPNIIDKIYKKTGGGIWLHGTHDEEHKFYTRGCVALNNVHFNEMAVSVKVGTPVIISENLIYPKSTQEYEDIKQDRLKLLDNFTKSWSQNNKEVYSNFIHDDFRTHSGVKHKKYVNNKLNLMDIYPKKVIENSNVKVFMHSGKYTVFDINQYYCAANMSTYSNKKYYFLDNKLISEEIHNLPLIDAPGVNNSVLRFIDSWIDAWKSQDINNYMSFYDIKFKTGKIKYKTLKERKTVLFSNKKNISIELSDVKWYVKNGVYTVTFIQNYNAGELVDKGLKTLELSGCPGSFKIISEKWSKI